MGGLVLSSIDITLLKWREIEESKGTRGVIEEEATMVGRVVVGGATTIWGGIAYYYY